MFYSALLGHPVEHSVSPTLFKAFAELAGIEYGHVKVDVKSSKDLKKALNSLQELNFSGYNITLPYKLDVIKHLDSLSPDAKGMGAVNTVVIRNNKHIGYNTDAKGAFLAIEKKLKKIKSDDHILILGAGGAARAIIYECFKVCKNITILNRDLKEGKLIADSFSTVKNKIVVEKLDDENIIEGIKNKNIIINATSVGMHPDVKEEIISKKIFGKFETLKNKYFFDAIFNPYKTKFLINAESKGAKVCSGTYMMIYQAVYAFKLWTGIDMEKIDIEKVNDKLIEVL